MTNERTAPHLVIGAGLAALFLWTASASYAGAAAVPGCTIRAASSTRAGVFFNLRLDLGGGSSGTVTRDDGTIVATTSSATSTVRAYATNVLGPHTYTLAAAGKASSTCSTTIDFTYVPDPVSGYDIIVVAGQSNAAGVGLGPFSDPTSAAIDSRIVQIGRIGLSDKMVVPVGYSQGGVLSDGLHFWNRAENDTMMAFALTFARWYVRRELAPGRKVLIVPAAYGGTSIQQWLGQSGPPPLPIYADMIDRAKIALALPGANRVVAFLWHQGETDVGSIVRGGRWGMTPMKYRNDLLELFADVRRDIPAAEPYPILAGLLVPTWNATGTPYLAKRSVQQAIAAVVSGETRASLVSSTGLTSGADTGVGGGTVHFNAQSQVIFGKRYFAAWSRLVHGTSSAPADPGLLPVLAGDDVDSESGNTIQGELLGNALLALRAALSTLAGLLIH